MAQAASPIQPTDTDTVTSAASPETTPKTVITDEQALVMLQRERNFTKILMTWAIGSMASGILWMRHDDPKLKGVGEQFFAWGLIDGILAINGLRGNSGDDAAFQAGERTHDEVLNKGKFLRTILLVNTGLDVVYMLAGRWLTNRDDERWQGWGWGIIVQGFFLFVFDLVFARSMSQAIQPAEDEQ